MIELDEYPMQRLEAEIQRRRIARHSFLCDYCGRPGDTPSCKFPQRHQHAVPPRPVTLAEIQQPGELLTTDQLLKRIDPQYQITYPQLELRRASDGYWLAFDAPDGRRAALKLDDMTPSPMASNILHEWAEAELADHGE